jgi:4-diphosphocytidyl-2-C-methyl-D-erythritol kinase
MSTVAVFSPAKINLFLSVVGYREDGFHELVSLVAPLRFGDSLWISLEGGERRISLDCDVPIIPVDRGNLAWRAVELFRDAFSFKENVHISLRKRVPIGAGLGGGSSNAVAVLRGLNQLLGKPLDDGSLAILASQLGSDCPLFLRDGPCLIRGWGELIDELDESLLSELRRRKVLVFKPEFSVSTAWAYQKLASLGCKAYMEKEVVEENLGALRRGDLSLEKLMVNSFQSIIGTKFPAIPLLVEQLRNRFEIPVLMSGSGSACFALLKEESPVVEIEGTIQEAWGPKVFLEQTNLL